MAWSTREIADLAGTTVNTVRHYHRLGLLEEPDRMSNGYKQYEVRHLVRLLQIRRLRDLDVPLDQIELAGQTGDRSREALQAVDADLAASIERLQRARAEVRAILQGTTLTDLPAGFEDVGSKLTRTDRSLMLIYSQLYDEEAMSDLRRMLEDDDHSTAEEFDQLDPDADEETRRNLAERYGASMARNLADYPWLTDPTAHLQKSPKITQETFIAAVQALHNPAQLDVMGRAGVIAARMYEQARAEAAEARDPEAE
ncbi:DNA-binding transcriptional MerR regulator [Diaminobutyricimonas aerilata]|uniref:DNA-binding transcriptional MerR regulator n=1 Tax=Diaminobutyricimonas aerilata TaxID=1162967 RepID=A0A2M9CFF4_9MICO|nr:MerR family transcriptional regulator [Diaminobutyricimonas aerilata]PJJ70607.1 DNA-binding transcriptional MerR regulator [Diaminobutyricimonas aerilata]